jgi:hypothetical protein
MCPAARFTNLRRQSALISLLDQDRSQWDQELVGEGLKLLELSATGSELAEYHVEAAIGGRAERGSRARARRDPPDYRPRSPRRISVLLRDAWRARASLREARDGARALPSSARSSRNPMERRFLDRRVGACERGDTQRAYYEQFFDGYSWLSKFIWKPKTEAKEVSPS